MLFQFQMVKKLATEFEGMSAADYFASFQTEETKSGDNSLELVQLIRLRGLGCSIYKIVIDTM